MFSGEFALGRNFLQDLFCSASAPLAITIASVVNNDIDVVGLTDFVFFIVISSYLDVKNYADVEWRLVSGS